MADRKRATHPCCHCGMLHGPGNCVRVEHFIDMLVDLFNRFEGLEKRLRKKARRG